MDPDVRRSWERFLNPEVTRRRLLAAAVYIASFESLKECVLDRIRDFYCIGIKGSRYVISPKYRSEVLSRNRSPVYASLAWLCEMGAIDESDIATFDRLKECRNKLAHELLSSVVSADLPADLDELFRDLMDLLSKIEVWWVLNVELPTSPAPPETPIDERDVLPGSVLILRILHDIALGDDVESRAYYDLWRRLVDDQ